MSTKEFHLFSSKYFRLLVFYDLNLKFFGREKVSRRASDFLIRHKRKTGKD